MTSVLLQFSEADKQKAIETRRKRNMPAFHSTKEDLRKSGIETFLKYLPI